MPDLTAIAAALGSLKTATDIVKFLRESDLSLEKAELKLKFADLVIALADTKIQLVELQETLTEKEKRIAELEDAFQFKNALIRRYDAYYAVDAEGNPSGVAFCLRCWENDHKKMQLVMAAKESHTRICSSCGHKYQLRLSQDLSK